MFGDHLQAAAQARRADCCVRLLLFSPGNQQFGGLVSVLGTSFLRIRVALAGAVLLTVAAVALGLGSTRWLTENVPVTNSVLPPFHHADPAPVRTDFGHLPLVFEAN